MRLYFHPQPPLMSGDLDLAEQRLAAGLEQFPDEPLLVSLQGMLHARRNQTDPALECVRRALEATAFLRPHASHLLPDRLRVCSTR